MAESRFLAPEKRARLLQFLGSLPNGAAAKLFQAIEHDRAAGGAGLPHDLLIDQLRSQLVEREGAFPTRPLTAQRIFFTPFEDFFVAHREGKKRRARIARSSIAPIWRIVTKDPACASASRAIASVDAALVDGSSNRASLEDAMFNAAGVGIGRLIAHAEADQNFRADLSERLGGPAALYDLAEMHLLLSAVEHLRAMQTAFPKPIATLTEEELFEARRLYARARGEAPDVAPYLLLALMGRMETPWRALSLYYHLANSRDEALGSAAEDAGIIVDTLFEDLENSARMLERDAEGDLDAEDAALRVRHFSDFAEGLAREARRAGDNVTVNRVEACRDIAADSLSRFWEQSLAAMRRAMPVRHAGASSRLAALRPDYSRAVNPRAAAAAREAARFLAASEEMARRLSRAAAGSGVHRDAVDEARRYLGDVVVEIRAAEGEDRVAARRLMEHALSVTAPLLPADEIALFRERAQAAAVTA